MKIITFIVTLMIVAPAFGQSRVFTNADLGKPLSRGAAVKADQAAAILAPYQYVDAVPREWFLGPTVTVINSSPTAGPFGEFPDISPTWGLDGSLSTHPFWSAAIYGGRRRYLVRGGAMPLGYPPWNAQWNRATTLPDGRPYFQVRPASATGRGASRPARRRITPR